MQRILKQIKEQNFSQAYLLFGEERYLKNQYTQKLREALAGDDEMNTHFYEGKDISVGEIIDLAETMPFLAPRRVIFLKNSGLLKSGGEKLAEYLNDSPNETTFFVFRFILGHIQFTPEDRLERSLAFLFSSDVNATNIVEKLNDTKHIAIISNSNTWHSVFDGCIHQFPNTGASIHY